MKTKISVAASAIFFTLGAVGQIWAPQLGSTFMLLGVMCALAAIVIRQETLLRRVAKHERLIQQVQKTAANGKVETTTYGASILRRVKLLTDDAGTSSAATKPQGSGAQTSGAPAPSPTAPTAGRAATPEVSNPFTDESLHSMLTPGRVLKVAGVFAPSALPDVQHVVWSPGDVSASLEREKPEVLLLDEQEIHGSARWSSATTAPGTALMRELLAGVRWAGARGVPVYLLPASLAADVHSSALRRAPVVVLPLDAKAREAAAGAPPTPLLGELQKIALERNGEPR